MQNKIIITIDGPAGSGKTTISKRVAEELDLNYIDTGALYRGIAYELFQTGSNIDSEADIADQLHTLNFEFIKENGLLKLFSSNTDISGKIRTPEISMMASRVSAYSSVRDFLLKTQRDLGNKKNVVFEGRDTGTVIFPDADFKFFLTASVKVRAKRRFSELGDKNNQSLVDVEKDIKTRDCNDTKRKIAPLKKAEDALEIDTSEMTINEVVYEIVNTVNKYEK